MILAVTDNPELHVRDFGGQMRMTPEAFESALVGVTTQFQLEYILVPIQSANAALLKRMREEGYAT